MELLKNGDHALCSNCGEGYHFGDCCGLKAKTWRGRGRAEKDRWTRVQCRPLRKTLASKSNHSDEGSQPEDTEETYENSCPGVTKEILKKTDLVV